MDPEEIRLLGVALAPLSIVLFACEMCSNDDAYAKSLITERAMGLRTAYCILKLPASILLPLLLLWYGVAAIVLADILSIICVAKEQKLYKMSREGKGG